MENNTMLHKIDDRLSRLEKSLNHLHQSDWFTIGEAAAYIRFSIRQIHRWIDEGILKSKKINGGRKLLIHRKWLDSVVMFGKSDRLTPKEKQELNKLETK